MNKPTSIITVAPNVILVNGYFAARSFREFNKMFIAAGYSTNSFKNWPFIEGISTTLPKATVKNV